jgi:probable DNA metabolism protein
MPDRSDVIYQYDGSFEGLLSCVFESYERREIPAGIAPTFAEQTALYPARTIETDLQKAKRVLCSIPEKIGDEALYLVNRTFLTCMPQKELDTLRFLRTGYRVGSMVTQMLADSAVDRIIKGVRYLENESNQYRQFTRFAEFSGILAGVIEPHNYVLPLIAQHFCERLPCERFLIYDKTHGMALIHNQKGRSIVPIDGLRLPEPDEPEEKIHDLWRLFYNTIEVPGRHNERCRMSHMPKRYWTYMTEFGTHKTFEDVMAEKEAQGPLRLP